jgi:hypothetical protein
MDPSSLIGYSIFRDLFRAPGAVRNALRRRTIERAVSHWRDTTFEEMCSFLVSYYERRAVPLVTYPLPGGLLGRVPLCVRPEWVVLTDLQLRLQLRWRYVTYVPTKEQAKFFAAYPDIRKGLGLGEIWDGRIFRLVALEQQGTSLNLTFEEGRFFDSVKCQYLLEHELSRALKKTHSVGRKHIPLREKLTSDLGAIEHFCEHSVVRIGVSNLVLLRCAPEWYLALVQRRGIQSMGAGYDPVSSGVFDISSGQPEVEFGLRHKVLKEVYEELFHAKEVERDIRELNPRFFYDQDGIRDIIDLLESGGASFMVTGFCIDLIRMVPEITTVLIVRDQAYYDRHMQGTSRPFKLNEEYGLPQEVRIPRAIDNLDGYLANDFPAEPGQLGSALGFSPLRWTLPGGFCFYQGLSRAIGEGLL